MADPIAMLGGCCGPCAEPPGLFFKVKVIQVSFTLWSPGAEAATNAAAQAQIATSIAANEIATVPWNIQRLYEWDSMGNITHTDNPNPPVFYGGGGNPSALDSNPVSQFTDLPPNSTVGLDGAEREIGAVWTNCSCWFWCNLNNFTNYSCVFDCFCTGSGSSVINFALPAIQPPGSVSIGFATCDLTQGDGRMPSPCTSVPNVGCVSPNCGHSNPTTC